VPPQQTAPLQRIEESADLSQQGEAKVLVKSIAITGNQEIASAELQPLVAGLIGAERSLSQLNAAARRITAYYRSKGFAVARAYLPAQDITDGAVTISIIEGRISSHKINNQSLLSDERAQAYLGQVKDGDVIRSEQIDRGLLLLQDTPGVSSSRATLQPGASVGTSELLIEVNPAKPYSGSVVARQLRQPLHRRIPPGRHLQPGQPAQNRRPDYRQPADLRRQPEFCPPGLPVACRQRRPAPGRRLFRHPLQAGQGIRSPAGPRHGHQRQRVCRLPLHPQPVQKPQRHGLV
jgi:hypothetical protein